MNLPVGKFVDSFHEISFRGFNMPIITVYDNPSDLPGLFVARIYDFDQSTPYAMVKTSLKAIRKGIPVRFARLAPMVGDDPAIVEVWI